MSEAPSFVVILAQRGPRDPLPLAKALAAARQTPLQDQMITAKTNWGILAENLSESEAKKQVEALRQGGVESLALPASSIATLAETKRAAAWPSLVTAAPLLLSVAALTTTSITTKTVKEGPTAAQKILSTAIMLGTGLPVHIGGKTHYVEKTQQHSEISFVLDLHYRAPAARLRVQAEHFDYSFLKERKLYQVLGNFKGLVKDLTQAYPQAWINHGATVLLEGKPIQTMGYNSLAELERESRWLLTLQSQ